MLQEHQIWTLPMAESAFILAAAIYLAIRARRRQGRESQDATRCSLRALRPTWKWQVALAVVVAVGGLAWMLITAPEYAPVIGAIAAVVGAVATVGILLITLHRDS